MKQFFQLTVVIVLSLLAGSHLHKCQSPNPSTEQSSSCVVDTITYTDTIPHYEPKPKQEVSLGTKIAFLPVSIPKDSTMAQDIPDSVNIAMQNIPKEIPDSIEVEIPITQKEYEAEEYHAWVSGYEPSLDSIFVYSKREVVTIREPPNKPKRWGIGLFAGYGYTPQGFQPCAGISINYNLWNF